MAHQEFDCKEVSMRVLFYMGLEHPQEDDSLLGVIHLQ